MSPDRGASADVAACISQKRASKSRDLSVLNGQSLLFWIDPWATDGQADASVSVDLVAAAAMVAAPAVAAADSAATTAAAAPFTFLSAAGVPATWLRGTSSPAFDAASSSAKCVASNPCAWAPRASALPAADAVGRVTSAMTRSMAGCDCFSWLNAVPATWRGTGSMEHRGWSIG